jgi:hypothetical protein
MLASVEQRNGVVAYIGLGEVSEACFPDENRRRNEVSWSNAIFYFPYCIFSIPNFGIKF